MSCPKTIKQALVFAIGIMCDLQLNFMAQSIQSNSCATAQYAAQIKVVAWNA